MIYGFVVEVTNTRQDEQTVLLFKEMGLPKGVTVFGYGTQNDYSALLSLASTKGFMGSGINTDTQSINRITLFKENETTPLDFEKGIAERDIKLNVTSKYLEIVIPPSSNALIQLLPVIE